MKREKSAAARLVLVRHGETAWNLEGRIQGHLDSPLNEQGIAQAEALGRRLAAEAFAALYSSDLGRALQTARAIAERTGHEIVSDARLRERHLGVLQGMTRREAAVERPADYGGYMHDGPEWVVPGGESALQCFARNLECLEEIAARHGGETVVVVAHGGVLDGIYRHATGVPHEGPRAFTILNASLNWFRFEAGRWTLDRWGDVAHLEADALDDV